MTEELSGVEKLIKRDCQRCPILQNILRSPNHELRFASISVTYACEKPEKAILLQKETQKVIRIFRSKIPYCLTLLINNVIPHEKLYILNNNYFKISPQKNDDCDQKDQ